MLQRSNCGSWLKTEFGAFQTADFCGFGVVGGKNSAASARENEKHHARELRRFALHLLQMILSRSQRYKQVSDRVVVFGNSSGGALCSIRWSGGAVWGQIWAFRGEMERNMASVMRETMVTWQDAEDALMEAVELLGRMPDRERVWQAPGRGERLSGWPSILREQRVGDYPDSEARPRSGLSRGEVGRIDAMLLSEQAHALAIPQAHRALVGLVLVRKLDPRGGFAWSDVWQAMGGKRCGVTSDALRMRYERAVSKVAVAMERG